MITKLRFFFTLMLLFVGIGFALAQDETFDLTTGYSNGDAVTEVKGTNVTLTFAKGSNNTYAPAWYTEGTAVRLYGGNTMKVAANDANNVIQKVVITCVPDYAPTKSKVGSIADNGTCALSTVKKQPTVTWTGNSNSVTFKNPASNGHWCFSKIVVTYAASGTATKKTTTVTFPKSNFTFTQNSTEARSFGGQKATVTASDGTILSDAALTYTASPNSLADVDKDGTVHLDNTKVGVVTVTATYAGDDNYYGSSASYTITIEPKITGDGTEANPYTVADIILMNSKNTLPTEEVYVKGTITTQKMSYEADGKSIDYYISDDGNTTHQIEVYGGKGLNGADFSAETDLTARSTVIVKGTPLYNNSKNLQINSGSQIVCLDGHYDAVNVTSAGYATYVTRHAIDMSNDTEVKAYAVSYDETNDVIKLNQVTVAPANTALVFQATEGKHMLTAGNSTTALTNNDLTFYTTDTKVTTDHSVLILAQNSKGEVGFHPVKVNTTVAAYKGVLLINSGTSTKGFYGLNDDATTGIGHVSASTASNGERYNLAGQRVNANFKGVIIVNGKKFIQK